MAKMLLWRLSVISKKCDYVWYVEVGGKGPSLFDNLTHISHHIYYIYIEYIFDILYIHHTHIRSYVISLSHYLMIWHNLFFKRESFPTVLLSYMMDLCSGGCILFV